MSGTFTKGVKDLFEVQEGRWDFFGMPLGKRASPRFEVRISWFFQELRAAIWGPSSH